MTKSTITREQATDKEIQMLIDSHENGTAMFMRTDAYYFMAKELQERRKADSEPVAWLLSGGGTKNVVCFDSGNAYADPLREVTPLYRHAQPVPEYPETLPCPVLLEPGLRFGKGIKTSTMLAALARRAVHESNMAALSPEERAEFQARIEDFKALIAQPVPVVPQDVLEALQKVARISLDMNDFDGDRRGIADCLGYAEEALIEVVNRRAAMLVSALNHKTHNKIFLKLFRDGFR
ncbi:hypothetical protein N7410_06490 [Klebsiella pasteurii]|uniref:hypothetical protein n=1 Tax=Klebsiella pasteurii TaxID=2587529 RepID=UPI00244804E4|nr:hypothetical protein [Klebsiella pasteurii]MDH0310937.1 hypothetical protein [Klebsiella pasteurii]